jgi:hypothetical protein
LNGFAAHRLCWTTVETGLNTTELTTMDIDDIDAVLAVSQTLETHGYSDAAHTPGLIADLFRWADGRASQLAAGHSDDKGTTSRPKAKRGKAKAVEVPDDTTESNDSDDEEPF